MPWHPQILADQLTLSQPGGADYDHHINNGTPGFLDLPTTLIIVILHGFKRVLTEFYQGFIRVLKGF
jgi:hypothetical protein